MLEVLFQKVRIMKNNNEKHLLLLAYKEFGDPEAPSLKDSFCLEPYENQKDIIEYLKRGKITLTATGHGTDAFTGDIVPQGLTLMTDSEYSWSNMLIYYIEKYNFKPPQEFIDKVMNIWKTGTDTFMSV